MGWVIILHENMSKNLDKVAAKLTAKYAQQAPAAPVVPAAQDANYVNFVNEFQKLLTNATAGLGQDATTKILDLIMPYKNTAAATSPENVKAIVQAIAVNLNAVQTNLNAVKQLANNILSKPQA